MKGKGHEMKSNRDTVSVPGFRKQLAAIRLGKISVKNPEPAFAYRLSGLRDNR